MIWKYGIFLCAIHLFVYTDQAIVKRDARSSTPNPLEALTKNMDAFKKCIDQSLASTVNEVGTKQLQPIFSVIGDSLNRFSKAFEDLTAKSTTLSPDFK